MSATIDPIIPKSLMESIKATFSIQASTPIQILSVAPLASESSQDIDLVAVIGLSGKTYYGTLALCFQKKTIIGIINKMLGENYADLGQDNSDAAGELLNIIYASARVKINESGLGFEPAIPAVIRGIDIRVSHGTLNQVTKIDCMSEFGPFHVEVSLKRS